jgi:Ca-activated chloride channel family protein
MLIAAAAEVVHARRVRHVAGLAFGPRRRPALWAWLVPPLRVAAAAAVAWGLVTLMTIPPRAHAAGEIPEGEYRNLLLVLDVSPSMLLKDAGPTGKQPRKVRAAAVLKSFFERVPIETYKISVVAFFTGAKPVVVSTTDREVVNNILGDLPMQYAFKAGPSDLFAGLQEAARIAHPWRPRSTTLVIVSDGDTVPATGMPKLPDAVAHVLVVGVGDPMAGAFIAGRQSRQDASTLRQVAVRLGGTYHNANEKQVPTDVLRQVTFYPGKSALARLTRREYALMAVAAGAVALAVLPVLLYYFGTRWRPGVPVRQAENRPLAGAGAI